MFTISINHLPRDIIDLKVFLSFSRICACFCYSSLFGKEQKESSFPPFPSLESVAAANISPSTCPLWRWLLEIQWLSNKPPKTQKSKGGKEKEEKKGIGVDDVRLREEKCDMKVSNWNWKK